MSSSAASPVLVLYHCPCPDGAFAALAAHRYFALRPGLSHVRFLPHATYVTVDALLDGALAALPQQGKTAHIYLVDYMGPSVEWIVALCARVLQVTLLDHHKTAQEALDRLQTGRSCPNNLEVEFDMKRSGATISLDYFARKYRASKTIPATDGAEAASDGSSSGDADTTAPADVKLLQDKENGGDGADKPQLLGVKAAARILFPSDIGADMAQVYSYIEDHDLYKHELPSSEAFTAGRGALAIDFDVTRNASVWDQLQKRVRVQACIQSGMQVLEENNRIVADNVRSAFVIQLRRGKKPQATIGGDDEKSDFGKCLAVVTSSPQLRSQIGNVLAAESGKQPGLRKMAAVVYAEEAMKSSDAFYKVSLRSIGDEDTTAVSIAYGGGGHKNASSFLLERSVFDNEWRCSGDTGKQ